MILTKNSLKKVIFCFNLSVFNTTKPFYKCWFYALINVVAERAGVNNFQERSTSIFLFRIHHELNIAINKSHYEGLPEEERLFQIPDKMICSGH